MSSERSDTRSGLGRDVSQESKDASRIDKPLIQYVVMDEFRKVIKQCVGNME